MEDMDMTNSNETTDRDAWLVARRELLAQEKQLTQLRDAIGEQRRALPRLRLEQDYVFVSSEGPRRLVDLFEGKQQLLVYHFMFGPDRDVGCPSCSFWADHFDSMIVHLRQRDTAFVAVSRAPWTKLAAYAQRLGWRFPWVSSEHNTFNHDFAVSFSSAEVEAKAMLYNFGTQPAINRELPGASAFLRDGDTVFHTYSTYARGLDMLNPTYHWLDLTANGRDEAELSYPMAWVRRHDEYPG